MRAILFIVLVDILKTCTLNIKDVTSTFLWYPKVKSNLTAVSPEFSWIYFGKNTNNIMPSEIVTYSMMNVPQLLNKTDLNSIVNSNWDATKQTKIIIHGFDADYQDSFVQKMKNRFLALKEDYNVIAVDWGPIAKLFYLFSVLLTDKVGKECSELLDVLSKFDGHMDQFHLIGHSLGAHICGFAAKNLNTGKIGRITGLDPAYPGFITVGKDGRLDSSDAKFVDCIHTCGGLLSFEEPICDADFYPNGGSNPQPGCKGYLKSIPCSHSRSHVLYLESMSDGHLFPALGCTGIPTNGSALCLPDGAYMGYPADGKYKGVFYTKTNSKYPYAPVLEPMH